MAGKRIGLSVPHEADLVLTQLSKLTNTPKTTIINELIMDTLPAFLQVVKAIEQSKQGQQELAVQTMADFLAKASVTVNQAHLDLGEIKGRTSVRTKKAKRGK